MKRLGLLFYYITPMERKGKGMVATINMNEGVRIIDERPLFCIPKMGHLPTMEVLIATEIKSLLRMSNESSSRSTTISLANIHSAEQPKPMLYIGIRCCHRWNIPNY